MPPKKPSGYQNRKRRAEAEKNRKSLSRSLSKFLKSTHSDTDKNEAVPTGIDANEDTMDEIVENCETPEKEEFNVTCSEKLNLPEHSSEYRPIGISNESSPEPEEVSFKAEDPATWPTHLNQKVINILIQQGVTRIKDSFHFPRNEDNRAFSRSYFNRCLPNNEKGERKWLVYSMSSDSVFCFPCKIFSSSNINLTNKGFNDWKNLSGCLHYHENSSSHISACIRWADSTKRLSDGRSINEENERLVKQEEGKWRSILERIIAVSQYLASHNLPFRGSSSHLNEANNGNFLGLIELMAKFDPVLQDHIRLVLEGSRKDHYLSHNIQNEILQLMAESIQSEIIERTKDAKYFGIQLDCTPDVSHKEQMTIILRFVDVRSKKIEVKEHFLQFLNVKDTSGKGLSDALLLEMANRGLDLRDCRGQCYDNGSNMKGKNIGVQRQILNMYPRAFYVPCGAHSLNLVVADAAKSSHFQISFFGVIQRVYTLFSASTRRWDILKTNVSGLTPKPLSDTRWECRIESVKVLRYQLKDLLSALDSLSEDENSESGVRHEAYTLANTMTEFKFLVLLCMWYDILYQINIVSKLMQSTQFNVALVIQILETTTIFLKSYRENGFNEAEMKAKEIAREIGVEENFPPEGKRRVPRKKVMLDYEHKDETPTDPKDAFRIQCFNTLVDTAIQSVGERFELMQAFSDKFSFLLDFSKIKNMPKDLILASCKDLHIALSANEQTDIDGVELCEEILHLTPLLRNEQSPLDVLQFMRDHEFQDLFPNVWVVCRIFLSIPVTVATGERSFSKLKLIKTFLRSTMTQERLCALATISIESDLAKALDYTSLINAFAKAKARKVTF